MRTIAIGFLLAMSFTVTAFAANLTGQWVGEFAVSGADRTVPQHFTLKQNGKQITGSGGPDSVEQYTIENGRIDGDSISFELTSNHWRFKYKLKKSGEEMRGDLQIQNATDIRTAKVILKELR